MSQHDGWEEARGHAESIGKLAEFEQHMKELIEEQNKYIAAGIKGPLNSLERWVSNPVKETGNTAVGVGNLGYQLTYKLAELETAADLGAEGKLADAEKIYGRINSEIDTISKHISAMSGPEILKAITEMGTDGFMLGTVFKAGTHLLRNARLSNISMDEYLTNLCQEVGCEVSQNAKNMLEIFDRTRSSHIGKDVRWGMWRDLTKVSYKGREYAKINGRLYTRHMIDRMAPKNFGTAAGGCKGRGVPTCVVEDAIKNGTASEVVRNNVTRTIFEYNGLKVVTEEKGKIVLTTIPC